MKNNRIVRIATDEDLKKAMGGIPMQLPTKEQYINIGCYNIKKKL